MPTLGYHLWHIAIVVLLGVGTESPLADRDRPVDEVEVQILQLEVAKGQLECRKDIFWSVV